MGDVRATERRDLGVRLIVLYKAVKAVAEAALAVGLAVLAATGEIAVLRELAHALREDVASRWGLLLGRALAALLSQRGIHLVEIGLALDAFSSAVEGWSLWRGYRWGAWLVVFATATPLPLEIEEIVRTRRPWRLVLVLVNVAVVVYLARRIARRRSSRPISLAPRSGGGPGGGAPGSEGGEAGS